MSSFKCSFLLNKINQLKIDNLLLARVIEKHLKGSYPCLILQQLAYNFLLMLSLC